MKKILALLGIFLMGLVPVSTPAFLLGFSSSATITSPTAYEAQESVLKINNVNNYIDVGNISAFTVFGNIVFYTNQNNQLYAFNTETSQRQVTNIPAVLGGNANNVQDIQSTKNFLFIQAGGQLYAFNNTYEVPFTLGTGTFEKFSVYEEENIIYLATIYKTGSDIVLNTYSYSSLDLTFLGRMGNMNENHVLLTASNELASVSTLAVSNNFIYIVGKNSSNQDRLFIFFPSSHSENLIGTGYDYLNTVKILYANVNNNRYLINIFANNSNFSIFEINPSNYSVTKLLASRPAVSLVNASFVGGELGSYKNLEYKNGLLYICDSDLKTLQSFSIELSSTLNIAFNKVILASSGYDNGRFYDVNQMAVVSDSEFYFADTKNRRIQTLTNNVYNVYNGYKLEGSTTTTEFTALINPKQIYVGSYKDIFINVGDGVIKTNNTFTHAEKTAGVEVLGNPNAQVQNLTAITIGVNNTIYAVDAGRNQLLQKDMDDTKFQVINTTLPTFTTATKIKYDYTHDLILVYQNNVLYAIRQNGSEVTQFAVTGVTDFEIDFNGEAFLLTTEKLIKLSYNPEQEEYSETDSFSYDFSRFSNMSISKESGAFYLFNNKDQCITKIIINEFSNGALNYQHPIDLANNNLNQEIIKTAIVQKKCYVYSLPGNVGWNTPLTNGATPATSDHLIVLHGTASDSFIYVMYNYENKIRTGYVETANVTIKNYTEDSTLPNVRVSYKKVKVYKYPTLLKEPGTNGRNYTVAEYNLKDILHRVANITESIDNSFYFAIKLDNGTYGYVNSDDVSQVSTDVIQDVLDTNAEIFADSATQEVYVYTNENGSGDYIDILYKEHQVYVDVYDARKKYTRIVYVNEFGTESEGYVLTKHIRVHNNLMLIVAMVLMLVSAVLLIAIGLTFYFVKRRNDLNGEEEILPAKKL